MIRTRFVQLRCNTAAILQEGENRSKHLTRSAGDDADRLT